MKIKYEPYGTKYKKTELDYKTFGKKAMKQVLAILPNAKSFKTIYANYSKVYLIKDSNKNIIGEVLKPPFKNLELVVR